MYSDIKNFYEMLEASRPDFAYSGIQQRISIFYFVDKAYKMRFNKVMYEYKFNSLSAFKSVIKLLALVILLVTLKQMLIIAIRFLF